jgi:hypothetical protein
MEGMGRGRSDTVGLSKRPLFYAEITNFEQEENP